LDVLAVTVTEEILAIEIIIENKKFLLCKIITINLTFFIHLLYTKIE